MRKGFTLIELLVVIAIIGILAGIVLVSMGGARTKARDARRESDIHQIATAMEMYYSDNEAYATSTSMPTAISTYLDPVPKDPKTGDAYGWVDNSSDDQSYCAYATLETKPTTYYAASPKGTKKLSSEPTSTACW